jgi:ATP/maltotriose-dependent transcriptional regulator MalT/DNA-binding SARP family transcriptional activator
VILGQAAQGKSTLAAAWAGDSGIPAAWINLGPEDSDAVDLFHVLTLSLQHAVKDADFSPVLDYPAVTMGPREEVFLYKDWTQVLFERVTVPLRIVFDGLDRLLPDAPAFRLLKVLLDRVPQNVHLLMLSREMPPLDLQARKMRREAYLMTNQELAFTLDEVKGFFRKLQKMSLSADELKKIHKTTEGWVGGLILLSESLGRMATGPGGPDTLPEMPARFSEEAFRYFGEEIFGSLPPEVREFLIKSSILETIEPGFAKELFEVPAAGEILQRGVDRNLFVQSFYDKRRGWLFKYHQLFRDFLLAKLRIELSEEATRVLFLKAGMLHEDKGYLQDAVDFYLKAGDYIRAEALIQEVGMALLNSGKTGDLGRWLENLPRDMLQRNPWLLFYRYMTGRFLGSQEYLQNLLRAFGLFQEQNNTRGLLLSLASLIEASVMRGHPSIPPVQSLIAQAETLLASVPLGQHPFERAVLWFHIGFASFIRSSDPRKSLMACDKAYLLARDMGNVPLQANALINTHVTLTCTGEFAGANEVIRKVDRLLDKSLYPEAYALHLTHCILHYSFRGDLHEADAILQKAGKEIEEHGLTHLYPPYMVYDAWLKQRHGKYDEAEKIGHRLADAAMAMGNLLIYSCALMHLGMISYCRGDFRKAKDLLERGREMASLDEVSAGFFLECIKVVLQLTAYHLNEVETLSDSIEEIVAHLEDISHRLLLKEALLANALQKWKQGRPDEAAAHLEAGIRIMRDVADDQWLFLSNEDMLRVCILALELQVEGTLQYAAHLLSTRLTAIAGPELKRLSEHTDRQVAEKALEIRRAIHRYNLPRLCIQTLGGFRVLRGGTPLNENEWPAQQPKLLLKLIVSRGSRGVQKDVVLEELWPETAFDSAENNLKVVLHRLRKVLEPGMNKDFGSSYVHLRANLLSLDQELCRVDVDEFVSLMEKGRRSENDGETEEALSFYDQAMKLYGGDFLPEEPYRSWADLKREELRNRYLELLLRTAELNEQKRGTTKKAIELYRRIIQIDPLVEMPYQRLMVLYSRRGMRSAALKVYEDCRQALAGGIDSEPDDLTTFIYRGILESR